MGCSCIHPVPACFQKHAERVGQLQELEISAAPVAGVPKFYQFYVLQEQRTSHPPPLPPPPWPALCQLSADRLYEEAGFTYSNHGCQIPRRDLTVERPNKCEEYF